MTLSRVGNRYPTFGIRHFLSHGSRDSRRFLIQINGLSPGLGKNERKTGNLEHAMPLGCAIVWMDSKEAHVYRFSIDDVEQERIKARSPFRHIQHRAGMIGAGKEYLDRDYFDHIINALRGVR